MPRSQAASRLRRLPVFTAKIYLFGPERVQTVKIGLNRAQHAGGGDRQFAHRQTPAGAARGPSPGRSLRPSRPPLTPCWLRFGILPALAIKAGSAGTGDPERPNGARRPDRSGQPYAAARPRESRSSTAATTRSTSMPAIETVSVLRSSHFGRRASGGSTHTCCEP